MANLPDNPLMSIVWAPGCLTCGAPIIKGHLEHAIDCPENDTRQCRYCFGTSLGNGHFKHKTWCRFGLEPMVDRNKADRE